MLAPAATPRFGSHHRQRFYDAEGKATIFVPEGIYKALDAQLTDVARAKKLPNPQGRPPEWSYHQENIFSCGIPGHVSVLYTRDGVDLLCRDELDPAFSNLDPTTQKYIETYRILDRMDGIKPLAVHAAKTEKVDNTSIQDDATIRKMRDSLLKAHQEEAYLTAFQEKFPLLFHYMEKEYAPGVRGKDFLSVLGDMQKKRKNNYQLKRHLYESALQNFTARPRYQQFLMTLGLQRPKDPFPQNNCPNPFNPFAVHTDFSPYDLRYKDYCQALPETHLPYLKEVLAEWIHLRLFERNTYGFRQERNMDGRLTRDGETLFDRLNLS